MNEHNHETDEDEWSLTELIDFLRETWIKIVASGIIGSSLGIGYALIAPSKFQATSSIQVGKVAGDDVEAPSVLAEKLKMPTYYMPSTFTACNVTEEEEPGVALAKKLNLKLNKNAPVITITSKEKSIEDARKCLESVLDNIRINQNMLVKPLLETKNKQLDNSKRSLESAENLSEMLLSKYKNFNFSDPQFSAAALLLATTLNNDILLKDLRTQVSDLEIQLAPPRTKEAFFTTPIYASSVRVEPSAILMVLLGGIAGGVLAIAYLVGRRVWLKTKITK